MITIKKLFLLTTSIIALSNYITQPGNNFSSTESHVNYAKHTKKFERELIGMDQRDIKAIIKRAKKEIYYTKPVSSSHIDQINRGVIVTYYENTVRKTAQKCTFDKIIIQNSVQSMRNNMIAHLENNKKIDGYKLALFFDRNKIKRLVMQNENSSASNYPSNTAVCPRPSNPNFYANTQPSAPPAPLEESECCICFKNYDLVAIPCPNGQKHSAVMCIDCMNFPKITICPICRAPLYK